MDALSDVLSLLKLRTYMVGGLDVGGDLSIQFPAFEGLKCYAIMSGQGWLSVEGGSEPIKLTAGDCFLLPQGRPFRLATDLTLPAIDGGKVFSQAGNGQVFTHNGGGDCLVVAAHFNLIGRSADVLLEILPPIVQVLEDEDKDEIRWCLDRLMRELRLPRPGGFLIAQQLCQMMLVQVLRVHVMTAADGRTGWLLALADKQMNTALTAIHASPAHRWTLNTLAEHAGLSRTTFAVKFKAMVGAPPMEYLAKWRMLVAGDKLMNSSESIGAIASSLGYESSSAFSATFKRLMGCPPRDYRESVVGAPA